MRHGRGKLTYGVGEVYDGNWKDGRRNGEGNMMNRVNQLIVRSVLGVFSRNIAMKC
jgi:hypothetical protein